MSREEHFARQICHLLDHGVDDIAPAVAERLRAARWRAIEHQPARTHAHALSIVGAGGAADSLGGGHPLRSLLVALALLLGMGVAYYWNGFDQANINEEVDIALLSDDLPPKAYLDPGFQTWLSHYAQSAR
jgi:hypothetical protein